jgi:putative two-component system response regulator
MAEVTKETANIKHRTLLAIDDNPVNLRTLKMFLEKHFEVVPVKSGEEGFRVLKARNIDLILLDVEMPGMTGFEFLDALRSMPDKNYIPVICVTGHEPTPEFVQSIIHAGAKDLVAKPFEPATIITKVLRGLHLNEYTL